MLQTAESMVVFLDSSAIPGDAVGSHALAEWYKVKFGELRAIPPNRFLFDPTLLVAGIVEDLGMTLANVNRLDVRNKSILIPLCFVRAWFEELKNRLGGDDLLLQRIAGVTG